MLLQVMEDGRLTDGHGRTVDFRNTVIIMTSNLGTAQRHARRLRLHARSAPTDDEERERLQRNVERALQGFFRPEFLNRIDEIIIFEPLTPSRAAADRRHHAAARSRSAWRSAASTLELTDAAKEALVRGRLRPRLRRPAAAPDHRAPDREPAVKRILGGEFGEGDHVTVDYADGDFAFERSVVSEPVAAGVEA